MVSAKLGWALVDFERLSAARPDLRSLYALSFANWTGGVEYSVAPAIRTAGGISHAAPL